MPAHHKLSVRYTGNLDYEVGPDEHRRVYKIRPDKVLARGRKLFTVMSVYSNGGESPHWQIYPD